MQVELAEGEQARLHHTTTSNVEGVQPLGRWALALSPRITKDNVAAATSAWEKALALDLRARRALRPADDRPETMTNARAHVERALALDPHNADAQVIPAELMWMERALRRERRTFAKWNICCAG
jgi:hypothetical protein